MIGVQLTRPDAAFTPSLSDWVPDRAAMPRFASEILLKSLSPNENGVALAIESGRFSEHTA